MADGIKHYFAIYAEEKDGGFEWHIDSMSNILEAPIYDTEKREWREFTPEELVIDKKMILELVTGLGLEDVD